MKKSFYVKMHPAVHLYTSKALMSLYSKRKDDWKFTSLSSKSC